MCLSLGGLIFYVIVAPIIALIVVAGLASVGSVDSAETRTRSLCGIAWGQFLCGNLGRTKINPFYLNFYAKPPRDINRIISCDAKSLPAH